MQHLAVLLDAELSCRDALGRRMGAMIHQFLEAFHTHNDKHVAKAAAKFIEAFPNMIDNQTIMYDYVLTINDNDNC